MERETALLARTDGVVVDVGIGREPWTTLDLARIFSAPTIAIDVDAERVARAREYGIDARVASPDWSRPKADRSPPSASTDPQLDCRRAKRALATRLSPHLRRDIGADDG